MAKAAQQASGHETALQSIAVSRQKAKESLYRLNAFDKLNPHALFPPDWDRRRETDPQTIAHSMILGYRRELGKDTYLQKADAHDLWQAEIATVKVPKQLVDENADTIEVELDTYEENPNIKQLDYDCTEVAVSLESFGWWSMRFVRVHTSFQGSYGRTVEEEVQQKIVLPPKAIEAGFEQLDEIAARMGILAQIKSKPHSPT